MAMNGTRCAEDDDEKKNSSIQEKVWFHQAARRLEFYRFLILHLPTCLSLMWNPLRVIPGLDRFAGSVILGCFTHSFSMSGGHRVPGITTENCRSVRGVAGKVTKPDCVVVKR